MWSKKCLCVLLHKLIPPWSTVRGAGSGFGVQKPVKPPKPDKRPQILPRPPGLSSDHQDTFVSQSSSGVETGNPKGCLVDVNFYFCLGLFWVILFFCALGITIFQSIVFLVWLAFLINWFIFTWFVILWLCTNTLVFLLYYWLFTP